MHLRILLLPVAVSLLSGCIVKTAVDVATIPVKVAGEGVDLATTSKSEKEKKRQKRRSKLLKQHDREMRDCDRGDARACERADAIRAEIAELDRQR